MTQDMITLQTSALVKMFPELDWNRTLVRYRELGRNLNQLVTEYLDYGYPRESASSSLPSFGTKEENSQRPLVKTLANEKSKTKMEQDHLEIERKGHLKAMEMQTKIFAEKLRAGEQDRIASLTARSTSTVSSFSSSSSSSSTTRSSSMLRFESLQVKEMEGRITAERLRVEQQQRAHSPSPNILTSLSSSYSSSSSSSLPLMDFFFSSLDYDAALVHPYRTGPADPFVRDLPDALALIFTNLRKRSSSSFSDTTTFLTQLVAYICQNTADEFVRVRRVHDWIALNISYDVRRFTKTTPKQSVENVITSGLAVCAGYSRVMKDLCDRMNIPCEIVSGYGRGGHWTIFGNDEECERNHDWNKVRLAGRWYLVDCTWDAGHVLHHEVYNPCYHTGYFLADPRHFVHCHFPSDRSEQLLKKPLTIEEFKALYKPSGDWWEAVVELRTPLHRIMRAAADGKLVVEYRLKNGYQLDFEISRVGRDAGADEHRLDHIRNASFVQQEEDSGVFKAYLAFPTAGRYKVTGFVYSIVGHTGSSSSYSHSKGYVMFGVVCERGCPKK